MKTLDDLRLWYTGLQTRERYLVTTAAVCLVATLFYLAIWEPIYVGVREAEKRNATQREMLGWMTSAAAEARALKSEGAGRSIRDTGQPVTLIVERSAGTTGMNKSLSKIETVSDKGARVKLEAASFDQMLIWLNTLDKQYGIRVISADIDRHETPGTVNARLTLDRD